MNTPTEMDKDYALWTIKDTVSQLGQAVAIYAAALGSYWFLIG
jgi:hypothetical protein